LGDNAVQLVQEIRLEITQSVARLETTNPTEPEKNPEEDRAYDSEDPEYIPEDDSFVSVEVKSAEEKRMETAEERQQRFKRAVENMPEEITRQLDELLRGRYVGLKKIPRSEWI
jgi:DNA repair exonuclease SbcCD nuclease subunit